jgi:hypothetical protein
MTTIQQEFESFMAAAHPQGLPPNQARELRHAFFGGALVTMKQMMQMTNLSDDDAEKALTRLDKEIESSVLGIVAGAQGRG